MTPREYSERVHEHVHTFFEGHEARSHPFDRGPIQRLVPGFHVIEVDPGPRHALTAYVSVGAGTPTGEGAGGLEFLITAEVPAKRYVELLAMATHYHLSGEQLGLGHTYPVGEPWLTDSTLDHVLVSLPYPYGPDLEVIELAGHHVHIFWLLPITKSERDYKVAHGVEALEALFDAAPLEYWDLRRKPIV